MTPVSYDVVLRDGSTLRLRQVQSDDRPEIDRVLHTALPDGAVGLVAESGGRVAALASFLRNPAAPDRADVSFAMADGVQGRGIATRMLEILSTLAWDAGVRTFDAHVHRDLDRALRLFLDLGFEVERRMEGGVLHVRLLLQRTPEYRARAAQRSEQAAAASMRAFFEPRSVAVVGAGRQRGKIGSEVLHNLIKDGYTGRLSAVHRGASVIDGIPAVPRVTDVPGDLDLAVICVPAREVPAVIDDCIAKKVKAVVVITAGFAETGAAGRAVEADLLGRIRQAGMRMVGPNCMGLLNTDPAVRLNATFSPVSPPAGNVAMSTQSGALGLAILDYAKELHIGLSTFVSVGNKADVSSNDLIQYWAGDLRTRVILLYVESFGNPRKFSQIARRVGRRKPIVAVKSGRSSAGARAASSHTGALASRDVIVDALFRQAGVIRTDTIEELFDVAMLLSSQPVPRGRRVAILTNAGGPGILAADVCEQLGLELPALADETAAELRSFLPAEASVANPVDMIASASAASFERALTALLRDDSVDSALVIFIPPLVTRPEDVAEALRRAAATNPAKPVLAIFMSAKTAAPMLAPIPCFRFPEAAAAALARAVTYGEWLATPESSAPACAGASRTAARRVVDAAIGRGGGWLAAPEAQALLDAMRIPSAKSRLVETEDAAAAAAGTLGFPVVIKAVGPRILHKTELGAVLVDLADEEAVRRAWQDLSHRLADMMTGALVQEMVTGGVEMLVGALEDPTFGPVIACATGGTRAELLGDSQFRLPPLSDADAAAMISSLRGAELLRGYRGAPPADETALKDVLLRVSTLIEWCPEIRELDLNPVLVLPRGARAVDARVRVERPRPPAGTRRIAY
jgi:acetyl coenzyme A synthetase (ADP forming)-like protein